MALTIGHGVREGRLTDMLIDITPTSDYYTSHAGADFRDQGYNAGGGATASVAYYEINNAGDEIVFTVSERADPMDAPTLIVNTIFGTTDFDVLDASDDTTIISEQSGFDSDVWPVDLTGATGQIRLTNFDDTQAGVLAYVGLQDRIA